MKNTIPLYICILLITAIVISGITINDRTYILQLPIGYGGNCDYDLSLRYECHDYVTSYVINSDRYIKELPKELNNLNGTSLEETAHNIIVYQKEHFEYDDDVIVESRKRAKTPLEFFKSKKGVCIDYTIFTSALLTKFGYDSYIIDVYPQNGTGHTLNAILINHTLYTVSQIDYLRPTKYSILSVGNTWGNINELYVYKIHINNGDKKIYRDYDVESQLNSEIHDGSKYFNITIFT